MALQTEAAPPVVGEANKDTIDGETKSDENDTEDEVDLEEGEILDSGSETDEEPDSKSASPNESLKKDPQTSPTKKLAENTELATKKDKAEREGNMLDYGHMKFKKYMDHDMNACDDSDEKESSWYQRLSRKKPGPQDDPIDYRKELAMYAGSPQSSPEREGKGDGEKRRRKKSVAAKAKKAAAKRARQRLLEKKGLKPVRRVLSKKPCKFYQEGGCSKGEDCPFMHIAPRKMELCRYYLNGYCSKGRQCLFMHDEFPCKFFHTGAECYSGENCRFSHKPLTEEKKKLLQEYLKGYHNDDHHHHEPRKRQKSKSPEPPVKRPCLLGSPPRHIREAEETKRWQEEMMILQREKSTDAFQIHLSPLKQVTSPSKYSRPNFYVDTMKTPPKPGSQKNQPGKVFSRRTAAEFPTDDNHLQEQGLQDEDLRPKLDWANICALVESMSAPKENTSQFEGEAKFREQEYSSDSTTENNEPNADSNASMPDDDSGDRNEVSGNHLPISTTQETIGNVSPPQNSRSPPPTEKETALEQEPIMIPTHLPRKQQELLLRIQRHQKMKSAEIEDKAELSEKSELENEPQTSTEQNAPKEESYEEKGWTSSDEDDDEDVDKPLTDVLKKLRQTPPPKPKEIPQPKSAIDISQMLSSIMQKASENSSKINTLYQEQGKFWENILSGTVPPTKPATTTSAVSTKDSIMSSSSQMPKRRVLLPDPKPSVEKSASESRDPRLKNRDPRTAAAKSAFVANSLSNTNPPFLPLESRTESAVVSHQDLNPSIPSHTPALVVDGLKANIPYKLRSVTCKPLDYSNYIQASHSDPKLLNDPRLRKYMSQEANTVIKPGSASSLKAATLPDLPLFSAFPLPLQENSVSSGPSVPPITDMPHLPELKLPQQGSQLNDPRTRRSERRPSGSNTPPLLHSQVTDTPSVQSTVPAAASHLPRAMADPRMAKLHKPLDPRRPRVVTDSSNKTNVVNRLQSSTLTRTVENAIPKVEEEEMHRQSEETDKNQKDSTVKRKFGESKKNKAVHRNRKSSMDYASPLNSCDDNSSGALNYNSYNQRPQTRPRNNAVEVPLPKETLPSASMLVSALIPDFSASDSSNLDGDSLDASASLKDMFKTIDPTASPFC